MALTKKTPASGEQLFQILGLLPETERNEFWKHIAINGTWQGTPLDHVLYANLFEFRYREEMGTSPDKATMKKACEMIAEYVAANAETNGNRTLMLFMTPVPAGSAEQPTGEKKLPRAMSKAQMMEVVTSWEAVEARKKFRKTKIPENEQLELEIIAICKAGTKKPAHIWRELKKTGLYPELPDVKVRKLKYKLKKDGRLG